MLCAMMFSDTPTAFAFEDFEENGDREGEFAAEENAQAKGEVVTGHGDDALELL